jgi:hypothetical protein
MKINVFKKLALGILCLLILLNPLLSITQIQSVKAADETDESDEITDLTTTLINIDKQSSFKFNSQQSDGSSNYKPSIESTAYKNLLVLMAKFSGNENSFLSFDDLFASGQEPKLIIKQNDLSALKSMYCLSNILTKFNEDLNALYENLPKKEKETVDKEAKANNKSSLIISYIFRKTPKAKGQIRL